MKIVRMLLIVFGIFLLPNLLFSQLQEEGIEWDEFDKYYTVSVNEKTLLLYTFIHNCKEKTLDDLNLMIMGKIKYIIKTPHLFSEQEIEEAVLTKHNYEIVQFSDYDDPFSQKPKFKVTGSFVGEKHLLWKTSVDTIWLKNGKNSKVRLSSADRENKHIWEFSAETKKKFLDRLDKVLQFCKTRENGQADGI